MTSLSICFYKLVFLLNFGFYNTMNTLHFYRNQIRSPYRYLDDIVTHKWDDCFYTYFWISIRPSHSNNQRKTNLADHAQTCEDLNANLLNFAQLNHYFTIPKRQISSRSISRYFIVNDTLANHYILIILRPENSKAIELKILDKSELITPRHIFCLKIQCKKPHLKLSSNLVLSTESITLDFPINHITQLPSENIKSSMKNSKDSCLLITSYRIVSSILLCTASILGVLSIVFYQTNKRIRQRLNMFTKRRNFQMLVSNNTNSSCNNNNNISSNSSHNNNHPPNITSESKLTSSTFPQNTDSAKDLSLQPNSTINPVHPINVHLMTTDCSSLMNSANVIFNRDATNISSNCSNQSPHSHNNIANSLIMNSNRHHFNNPLLLHHHIVHNPNNDYIHSL